MPGGGTGATTSLQAVARGQVRVLRAPLASVAELVFDAFNRSLGTPAPWLQVVRQELGELGAVLGPLFGPGGPRYVPECLVPVPDETRCSFDEELDRLAQVRVDELLSELEAANMASTTWAAVARRPRLWLECYVHAMRRAWGGVQPLWERSVPLVERESERIGAALARGALDQVLDGLYRRGRVDDDGWYLRGRTEPAAIAPGFRLQPMLVGPDAALVNESGGAVYYFAYPVPGIARLDADRRSPPPDELAALLGERRAQILRLLDRPVPAGRLAEELGLPASALTYHVAVLERAGLAGRERAGKQVLVHRRARGTSLLDLYE